MPSPIEPAPHGGPCSPRAFALCLLVCAALQIAENLLPRLPIFPWLKLGLSHVVLLPFLLRFGAPAASSLLLGRNLLTLLFAAGSLSSFLIGTASGLAALLLGGGLVRAAVARGLLGMVGAGMLMAAFMNAAQLATVEGLFIRHAAFWFQAAPMLVWSAVSGAMVAWLAHRARPALEELFMETGEAEVRGGAPDSGSRVGFAACLAVLVGLFLLPGPALQGAAFVLVLAFSALRGRLGEGFLNLARGWPWFLYLAWLHLLFGEGEYLAGAWVTRPGLEAFLAYGARLASLILLGPHLAASFPRRDLAGARAAWVRGMVAALPLLPGLHAAAMGSGRALLRSLRPRGRRGAEGAVDMDADPGVSQVLRSLADGFRAALGGGASR